MLSKPNVQFLLVLLLFLCIHDLSAQSLTDFNQKRLDINKTGMLILGSWALGNMVINPLLGRGAIGERKYFYQMNTAWNAVNLAIAGFGYFNALRTDPSSFGLWESISEQNKMETILLVNSALDLGYMLGGLYLIERSKNTVNRPERLKGFGQGLILQGAFLMVFDISLFLAHQHHASELPVFLEGLTFSPGGIGWRMSF